MYIYFARDAVQPRFIVGKANSVLMLKARNRRAELKRKEEAQRHDLAMLSANTVIEDIKKLRLDVFELCGGAQPYVIIESDNYELFSRAATSLSLMDVLDFYVDKARLCKSTVLLRPKWEQYETGRWRATALVGTPVTDDNRDSLDPEYVRIIDSFPRSRVPRQIVTVHDPAAVLLF